jgi:superoxide dismutase, Cu-Zn family
MRLNFMLLAATMLVAATAAQAATTTVTVNAIDETGVGAAIGTIIFKDTRYGLLIEPKLGSLPPGQHGFHIHERPSCAAVEQGGKMVAGLGAGGHLDPHRTGKHLGPYEQGGHLGDMPVLFVDADGTASLPNLAPRLKVKDLHKHSVMIHAGGDNYSDQPAPLGGGGARIACGVID